MIRALCLAFCAALLPAGFATAADQSETSSREPEITAKQIAPANAASKIDVVSKSEPGEPMIITGHVTDGSKPIKGASVFVYHTDNEGYYANHRFDNGDEARLNGSMRTDASGRYEFRTIRPRSYAGTHFPAHVHYVVHAEGYRDTFTEFNFDDDPFVTQEVRDFNAVHKRGVLKMTRDSHGAWHGVFDVVLTRIAQVGRSRSATSFLNRGSERTESRNGSHNT